MVEETNKLGAQVLATRFALLGLIAVLEKRDPELVPILRKLLSNQLGIGASDEDKAALEEILTMLDMTASHLHSADA